VEGRDSTHCHRILCRRRRLRRRLIVPGHRGTLGVQNGHPRTHHRTQPTRTPSNACAEVVASTLLPVNLHVAPLSSEVGAVAELLVVTSRSLRRPVTISSPSACFQYFVAFSVERRVYHLTIDDDVCRRTTSVHRYRCRCRYRSSLPLFVTASNYYSRFSLLFEEALIIFGL